MTFLVHSFFNNLFKKDSSLTKVITLITATKLHSKDSVKQYEDNDSDLQKNINVK